METTYEIENIKANSSNKKVFYHVLFWVIFINYYGLIDNAFAIKYNINWLGYLLGVGLFYTVSLWIMPRFYEKKYYLLCFFAFLLLFSLYNLLMLLILYGQTDNTSFWSFINSKANDLTRNIIKNLYNFITYSSYGIVFWIFGFIKKKYKEKERTENESYAIEKDFLNGQINQHFLYNMLNLFYVKANRYSEHLANDILTFSELLRYSLKDDNKELVAIEKEIEVVKKMIHLFNSRLEKNIIARFEADNLPNNCRIPSNMLVLIYQNLFINADIIENNFLVTIMRIDFSLLRERLYSIYQSDFTFKEAHSEKHFELLISLPQHN
jgi:two-component system, LytTR family, sensor kinase